MGRVRLRHKLRYARKLLCILLVEGGGRADGIEKLVDGSALHLGGGGIVVKMIDVHGADARRGNGKGRRENRREVKKRACCRPAPSPLISPPLSACLLWKDKRLLAGLLYGLSLPRPHVAHHSWPLTGLLRFVRSSDGATLHLLCSRGQTSLRRPGQRWYGRLSDSQGRCARHSPPRTLRTVTG